MDYIKKLLIGIFVITLIGVGYFTFGENPLYIKKSVEQFTKSTSEEIDEIKEDEKREEQEEDESVEEFLEEGIETQSATQLSNPQSGYEFYELDGEQLEVPYLSNPEQLNEEIIDYLQFPAYDVPIFDWYLNRKPNYLAPASSTWYVYEKIAGWGRIGEDKWVEITDNMYPASNTGQQTIISDEMYYQDDTYKQKISPPIGTVTVLTEILNVRDDYTKNANIIGKATSGSVFNVYGIAPSGWYVLDDRAFVTNDSTLVSFKKGEAAATPTHPDVQEDRGNIIGEVIFKNASYLYFRDNNSFQFSYMAAPNEKHYIIDTYYLDYQAKTFLITEDGYYIELNSNVRYTQY